MKIGFTGSRYGMAVKQFNAFARLILELKEENGIKEFHHGDCVGADALAHRLISPTEIKVIVHPPLNSILRARCNGINTVILEEKDYSERNEFIVDNTDILIATPSSHCKWGGTINSIKYAQKNKKPVYIIYPDGQVEVNNGIQKNT